MSQLDSVSMCDDTQASRLGLRQVALPWFLIYVVVACLFKPFLRAFVGV